MAASDKAVAAMGDEYEWSSLVMEKNGLFFITHPTTSFKKHGVSLDFGSIDRLYKDGFSIRIGHHNHPTNPYFSDSDQNFSRGIKLSNMTTNPFKVTLRYGNTMRYVTQGMPKMSDAQIRRAYGLTRRQVVDQGLSGRIVKGEVCNDYVCE